MAKNYWITFRIDQDSTAGQRRDELYSAVNAIARGRKWWIEPTSFILFASEHEIDQVAEAVRSAIDERKDIVLIGMPDFKVARIIGPWSDQDLTEFMPFVKNA